MKKLILSLAIMGFVVFGALQIQNIMAASTSIELVNFDKDPKKDGDKKAADAKDAKADAKSGEVSAKDCSSSCSGKTASASCCDKSKESCATACPDKK
jgi:hypothetical protein